MFRVREPICLALAFLALSLCSSSAQATPQTSNQGVGVLIYENLEGYHASSSLAGTSAVPALQLLFKNVRVFDKVPLESNETVRILTEMTEGREVVVTPVTTFLLGGVIQEPTLTFQDDDIKFMDLTWHLDQTASFELCTKNKLQYALVGAITGLVNEAKSVSSTEGRTLSTVQLVAGLQLIEISTSNAIWAKTYQNKQAGFDPRTVFADLLNEIGNDIGQDITAHINQQ